MTRWGAAALAVLGAVLVPFVTRALLGDDDYWVQVLIWVMFFAYLSGAWNLIGGFAGQYSIGHAGLLGIGAYTSSLLYVQAGVSPWLGMLGGGVLAALVGGVIGYPCFRLRGAFFSLVTIAFAEMLRVGTELTDTLFGLPLNGVRGFLLPVVGSRPADFQFAGKRAYYYVMLVLLVIILTVGWLVKRSRTVATCWSRVASSSAERARTCSPTSSCSASTWGWTWRNHDVFRDCIDRV